MDASVTISADPRALKILIKVRWNARKKNQFGYRGVQSKSSALNIPVPHLWSLKRCQKYLPLLGNKKFVKISNFDQKLVFFF